MRGKNPWGPGKGPKNNFENFVLKKVSITMVRSILDCGLKLKNE